MSGITILIIVLVLLAVDVFMAEEFHRAALMKGWPEKKYFVIPLLLPVIGYLLIIALPDRGGAGISAIVSDDLPDI